MPFLFGMSSPLYLIWLSFLYPLYFVVFLWLFSKFSFHLVFKSLWSAQGLFFFFFCGFLSLLDVGFVIFHQFWKALSCSIFTAPFSLPSSWTPVTCMVDCYCLIYLWMAFIFKFPVCYSIYPVIYFLNFRYFSVLEFLGFFPCSNFLPIHSLWFSFSYYFWIVKMAALKLFTNFII